MHRSHSLALGTLLSLGTACGTALSEPSGDSPELSRSSGGTGVDAPENDEPTFEGSGGNQPSGSGGYQGGAGAAPTTGGATAIDCPQGFAGVDCADCAAGWSCEKEEPVPCELETWSPQGQLACEPWTVCEEGELNWGASAGESGDCIACATLASFAGEGTEGAPYQLSNYEEVQALSAILNNDCGARYKQAHYVLTADIDASPSKLECIDRVGTGCFRPLGPFSGTFDGQGHTIDGLHIGYDLASVAYSESIGFFTGIEFEEGMVSARVSNLHLANIDYVLTAKRFVTVGGLVGYLGGTNDTMDIAIENVSVSGRIEGLSNSSTTMGGLIGVADGVSVVDSFAQVDIISTVETIFTNETGNFDSSSTINSSEVGGLIGALRVAPHEIRSSGAAGTISVTGFCDVSGSIAGTRFLGSNADIYVGGLIGKASPAFVYDSFSNVEIQADATTIAREGQALADPSPQVHAHAFVYAGGIVGESIGEGHVERTVSLGSISADLLSDASGSSTSGTMGDASVIVWTEALIGGIIGKSGVGHVLEDCLSGGKLSATHIATNDDSTSTTSDALGQATIDAGVVSRMGGIIGSNYSEMSVKRCLSVGGISVAGESSRQGSLANGAPVVPSTPYFAIGQLFGSHSVSGEIRESNFFRKTADEVGSGSSSSVGIAVTDEELSTSAPFVEAGFDFMSVWDMSTAGRFSRTLAGVERSFELPLAVMPIPTIP